MARLPLVSTTLAPDFEACGKPRGETFLARPADFLDREGQVVLADRRRPSGPAFGSWTGHAVTTRGEVVKRKVRCRDARRRTSQSRTSGIATGSRLRARRSPRSSA